MPDPESQRQKDEEFLKSAKRFFGRTPEQLRQTLIDVAAEPVRQQPVTTRGAFENVGPDRTIPSNQNREILVRPFEKQKDAGAGGEGTPPAALNDTLIVSRNGTLYYTKFMTVDVGPV